MRRFVGFNSSRAHEIFRSPVLYIILLVFLSATGSILTSRYYINLMFERVEAQYRLRIVSIATIARNSIEPIIVKVRSKEIGKDEAIRQIRTLVRNMTYTDQDGKNYIFMSSYKGVMLVQPYEPDKEMTDQWFFKDVNGVYIVQGLIKAARSHPEGSFFRYTYYRTPDDNTIQEKMSYVIGIPEVECYIGTGMYMARAIRDQKAKLSMITYTTILFMVITIIPITVSIVVLFNRNRKLRVEIETRMRAESEVRASRKMLNDVLQAAYEFAIIGTDTQGIITSYNRGAEIMLGYSADEAEGKMTPMDLHLPTEVMQRIHEISEAKGRPVNAFEALTENTVRTGSETKEWTFVRKDGSLISVSLVVTAIRSDNGQIKGYLGIAKDVTELKKAEEENKRLQDQIIQSQKLDAVGQLAGGVAHDFNNILMGISGIASLMRMEHTPDDPLYHELKSIEEYVERGAKLTKQLLGFARGGKYEPKVFSVNDLVTGSARFFSDTKKEIEVKFDLQHDLPPVEADEGQIEQVFLNLYINAGHAMPNGGTINIQSREIQMSNALAQSLDVKPGRYVLLSVSDTGIGMDEQTLNRIFEPFFTTRLAEGGSGLGLASAYGIIRNHGGAIEVSSESGKGSIFKIYLPASDKNMFLNETADKRNAPVIGSDGILIIDDEEMILKTASALLKRIGYTVFKAQTMEEAVSVYNDHRNDIKLIILDMILKGTSGAQVLTRLKKLNPDVKVILSSGYGMEGEIRKVMDLGCQGFIQKPYQLSELSMMIKKILS